MRHAFFMLSVLCAISSVSAQKSVDVERVVLTRERVFTYCPTHRSPHSHCTEEGVRVGVTAITKSRLDTNFRFHYVPTAGLMQEKDGEVTWDLSNTAPGTYSISVGVGEGGVIRGKVATTTIVVEECDHCDPLCICPTVSMTSPTRDVGEGELFVVTVNASGGLGDKRTYRWQVTGGEIESGGRGTKIFVRASKESAGKNITVSVTVGGDFEPCYCPATAEVTVNIRERKL